MVTEYQIQVSRCSYVNDCYDDEDRHEVAQEVQFGVHVELLVELHHDLFQLQRFRDPDEQQELVVAFSVEKYFPESQKRRAGQDIYQKIG